MQLILYPLHTYRVIDSIPTVLFSANEPDGMLPEHSMKIQSREGISLHIQKALHP